MTLDQWMNDNVGPRCPDYEPGCPVCDAWHLYDIAAVEVMSDEMKQLDLFMDEWNDMAPTQWEQDHLLNKAIDLRIEAMIEASRL